MRFSVVVPLFNKAPYVEKALRSVLIQSFVDYELIVVNDGSTDNSLSVAMSVLAGTGAVVIDQKNSGVSIARNNGVAASKGDYICFLDADDWWDPLFLERMDLFIGEYPDARLWCSNYKYIKYGRPLIKLDIPTGYFNYCLSYANNLCMPIWTGSTILQRSVFDELGGFKSSLKLGEDFDLWIRIALKYKVAFLNEPLANYNQDADVVNRGTRRLQDPEYHMLWNLEYLEDEEKSNPALKQLMDNLRTFGLSQYYVSKQYHDAAVEQLRKVDWSRQKAEWVKFYHKPIWQLRLKSGFMQNCSRVKQFILSTL